MFQPPICPYPDCAQHVDPEPDFYYRHGYFKPKCRSWRVPRFRCRACRRTFSRHTFRPDYRDKRPHLNAQLALLFAAGLSIRKCGRILKLSQRCTVLKLRKLGLHVARCRPQLRH